MWNSDGRRVFTAEFERETVQRILGGEKTLAELSRDLDIFPTVDSLDRGGGVKKKSVVAQRIRSVTVMLPPRVHRRHSRPHLGQMRQPASNQRFWSDIFQIPCWSGEVVSVSFVIDCHDREVLAFCGAPRSLTGADIRTPAYSPQSNGMAEAFVKTVKRDYVAGEDLRNAERSCCS